MECDWLVLWLRLQLEWYYVQGSTGTHDALPSNRWHTRRRKHMEWQLLARMGQLDGAGAVWPQQ